MDAVRRNILAGAGLYGAAAVVGRGNAQSPEPSVPGRDASSPADHAPPLKLSAAGWDANSPPGLEFLFEARVELHLPAMDVGPTPEGKRVIFFVKGGAFEGPHLRGTVVPDAGADWILIRPDGSGHLDVRFCLETHDKAILYLHWEGRFWSAPDNAQYALDIAKKDDPAGAWRYYFRAAPQFETGDARYAWLNNIIAVTKSRTGDGGVIHRVFAVK